MAANFTGRSTVRALPTKLLVVIGSLGIGPLIMMAVLLAGWVPQGASAFLQPSGQRGDLPVLWQAPAFSLRDQSDRKLDGAALRGRPYIANFFYTQCKSVCPVMTAKLVVLQRRLRQRDLAFVSFSVDPAHDSPRALSDFARSFNPTEKRWRLLATEDQSLERLVAGFRIVAEPSGNSADPIIHSDLFFLVDGDAQVRGVYASREDSDLALLERDARVLSRALPPSSSPPTSEPSRYESLGCSGCHSQRSVAPPLVNLLGAERSLESGRKQLVDTDYLRASILEPARDIVSGYPAIMPSYAGKVSEEELQLLLLELAQRKTSDAPESAKVAVVEDPVCHMQIRAEQNVPRTHYRGHDVYFCSELCKTAFEKVPARYLP